MTACNRPGALRESSLCPELARCAGSKAHAWGVAPFPTAGDALSRGCQGCLHQHPAHRAGIGHRQGRVGINKLRGVRLAELETKGQALKALQDRQSSSTGIPTKAAAEKLQQEIDHAALEIQVAKQNADRELEQPEPMT